MASTRCDLGGRSGVGNQGAIAGASVGKKNSRSRCVKPRMICPHTPFVTSLRTVWLDANYLLDKPAAGETYSYTLQSIEYCERPAQPTRLRRSPWASIAQGNPTSREGERVRFPYSSTISVLLVSPPHWSVPQAIDSLSKRDP